ncbi:hypothetical protein RCL1_003861 [Eukaryota sp. TZLM3-RCL]
MSSRPTASSELKQLCYKDDYNQRQVCFSRRKETLFKNALSLQKDFSCSVLVALVTESGNAFAFSTPDLKRLTDPSVLPELVRASFNQYDASLRPSSP